MHIIHHTMTLISELIATTIILMTGPFNLIKLAFMLGVKATLNVFQTWMELVRATIHFHLNILWKVTIWTIAFISLPFRILTALRRERLLEQHLHVMKIDLENLWWDRKDLEDHIQRTIKECKIRESMLAALEDDYEKAIAKIELLESELQDLKEENLKLKEVQGKGFWSIKGQDDTNKGQSTGIADNYGISYGIPSWKSTYNESGVILKDLMMHKDSWEEDSKSRAQLLELLKTGSKSSAIIHPFTAGTISKDSNTNELLAQQRRVALSRSVFSALLSVLVGMIVWEAEDPCIPLVVALFTVVGMSLMSVVHFFSTIRNKPASDAVALLSLNWFILGTLTYPTLPMVARILDPMVMRFVDHAVKWFAIST